MTAPRTRYTAWDGSQRVRLEPDEIFRRLAERLGDGDDLAAAFTAMLRDGFDLDGARVIGLDELLEAVREEMRRREAETSLADALDPYRERLDELLELEREALGALEDEDRDGSLAREKRAFLDDLPPGLSDAVARLAGQYRFESEEAGRRFRELLDDLEGLREMEEFLRRHGERFRGPEQLTGEPAREAMRDWEALRRLEQALAKGDLGSISPADLARAMGGGMAGDLERLGQVLVLLQGAGYLAQRGGKLQLTPRGIRRLGQLALRDIFQNLLREREGGHGGRDPGPAELEPDRTRPWLHGDPVQLALGATLRHALLRNPSTPLRLEPEDFEVQEGQRSISASTVLLLDMSWSMSWEGRFAAAKKVALALESLIRTRYPRDYFGVVGFYTRAVEIRVEELPEASWNMGDPFTNLQDGLRLAGDLLRRHPSRNQHVILITDGQPTAYYEGGRLHCEWPMSFGGISLRAAAQTLKEVERITRRGITINTFMLDDSAGLRAFVDRMTRINRGRALYTRPDRLGDYLLVDYLARRRRRA